ncbi:MAG: 2-oxoacid:acceptor oxidoreductase family protein [Candidatus Muirbacterium halophilum]|nr:2-oxoacid:acceptor oxidoreductase family protein [Candidatus Muirbacterium halophilum]MCK9476039.1 2-oxoacid:acceptor oxidoreductase family protein [Candidatus Muirbacterium halophilum]
MKKKRVEIRLSGSGGQGLILGGVILAEAAAIYDGKNATQSQSYGPEARGGASKSEVIISDEEILFPKTENIDVLLCLTQQSCDSYVCGLEKDRLLVVDSFYVKSLPKDYTNVISIPFTEIARDEFKTPMVVNIIAIGAISEMTGSVSKQAMEKAVLSRVPKGTEELNKKALHRGIELAKQYKK